MASRGLTEQVKVGLAAGALLAAVIAFLFARLRRRAADNEAARAFMQDTPVVRLGRFRLNAVQTFWAALTFLALFGTLNYNRYSSDLLLEGWDEYDLLHYYITPKYFDELGYFRLLPALIIADHEAGPYCPGKTPVYLYQDEDDYARQPLRHALAREKEIKSHFTPERWKEFVHDSMYVQRHTGRLPCSHWRQLLQDHGFNGTPTWVLVARPIVDLVPVESIKVATVIDLVLILAMLAAVFWAFGSETFLFGWIFITIGYSFRWPTISWALLRYDWMTAMVIGICMIRKRKHYAGGALFAYATLMRYFPVIWLAVIVVKGGHALLARRNAPWSRCWKRVPAAYWKMAAGFAGALVLLLGISLARDGVGIHQQSLHNIAAHVEPHNLSSMRQGLQVALTYRGETDLDLISDEKKALVEGLEIPVRVASIVMILVLGLLLTRARAWEAVGLGLIPYFWLTTSSYYYYSMRMTAVVIHAADLSKPRNVVGLLILFGIELFCNASEHVDPGNRYLLISIMGLSLLLYGLVMIAFFAREWWTARKSGAEPPDWAPDGAGEEG